MSATKTSINAYHTHQNRPTDVERLARYILERTRIGKRSWIAQAARDLNMDKSSVSGRRNDLEKAGGITLDGIEYVLIEAGISRDPITKKKCMTYALVLKNDSPQLSLFE